MQFIGLDNNSYNIEDIKKCELKKEIEVDYHGEKIENHVYYAILKTGEKIPFRYHYYKRFLEDYQKIEDK